MKTKIDNFLLPVGIECRIPTHTEAFMIFSKQNLYGKIKLAIARNGSFKEIAWVLTTSDNRCAKLPAFDYQGQFVGNLTYTFLEKGSVFCYQNRNYIVIDDKDWKLVIKEIDICFNSDLAQKIGAFLGYPNSEMHLVKIFEQKNTRKYLCSGWIGKNNFTNTSFMMPVFHDDISIFHDMDYEYIDWEFMANGDSFVRDGKLWRVDEDENEDLLIFQPAPFMSIAK